MLLNDQDWQIGATQYATADAAERSSDAIEATAAHDDAIYFVLLSVIADDVARITLTHDDLHIDVLIPLWDNLHT